MSEFYIVVVGAGVSGLTTALLLSRCADYKVIVVAKHMPGDYDIEYASPWAGANYLPVGLPGTKAETHERNTWPELAKLAEHSPEAGIHFRETARYDRAVDLTAADGTRTADTLRADSWVKDVVPNFRPLQSSELPAGYSGGVAFTSVCINTGIYLNWLVSQCLKNGVTFHRGVLAHIMDAADLIERPSGSLSKNRSADVIVNCTGLAARTMGGVEDEGMIPVRGQTLLVRNEADVMCYSSGTEDGDEEVAYIMQRAAGGGTLIGGSYQKHNSSPTIDANQAIRIMKRAVAMHPYLTKGKGIEHLDIIRQGVGLRPFRVNGTRVEKERLTSEASATATVSADASANAKGNTPHGIWVVHNYGHGGYGYQASYGCAQEAVTLVAECLADRNKERARL